jgi:hypothetical protein
VGTYEKQVQIYVDQMLQNHLRKNWIKLRSKDWILNFFGKERKWESARGIEWVWPCL